MSAKLKPCPKCKSRKVTITGRGPNENMGICIKCRHLGPESMHYAEAVILWNNHCLEARAALAAEGKG
jgi:hypothetical protein